MADPEDNKKGSPFIRERLVENKRSKGRKFLNFGLKALAAVLLAVIFGAVAGTVFVKIYKATGADNDSDRESVSIPRDEESLEEDSSDDIGTETKDADLTEADTEVLGTEAFESWSGLNLYMNIYDNLSEEAAKINRSVVTILSTEEKTDWFDNDVESGNACPGIIWSMDNEEILVMSVCDFKDTESTHKVEFCDGTYADAYVKGMDSVTGLLVLSVSQEDISLRTNSLISSVSLGNSYVLAEGEPVLLVGNPSGYIGSVVYGTVTYIIDNMLVPDMSQYGIVTSASTYKGSNGFVVNSSGELLGAYSSDYSGDFTKAYSISDLKGILEKLTNGVDIAYLGVYGRTVTDKLATQYNLVKGVYVADTVADEAAYMAGIRSGDIIVAIDGEKINTLRSLQNDLEKHAVGDNVNITVMRIGSEEYSELNFNVTLGSR